MLRKTLFVIAATMFLVMLLAYLFWYFASREDPTYRSYSYPRSSEAEGEQTSH